MNAINRLKASATKPVAKLTSAQARIVLDFLPYARAHQQKKLAHAASTKAQTGQAVLYRCK